MSGDRVVDHVPTDQDFKDALRLMRKYIYQGEPYAPAVPRYAEMLAEHRAQVLAELKAEGRLRKAEDSDAVVE